MVRTIANRATQSWRELHEIGTEQGREPIPTVLEFPWEERPSGVPIGNMLVIAAHTRLRRSRPL